MFLENPAIVFQVMFPHSEFPEIKQETNLGTNLPNCTV